jgi:acetylornithine deacetylase
VNDEDLLRLHRALVATPSVSRDEAAIAALVASTLEASGFRPLRIGNNVAAVHGPDGAPVLHLCSHLDTVPSTTAWTRAPWTPAVEDGRVYGLGSNDAKASVAAMIAAFVRLAARGAPIRTVLALTAEEEVGGKGVEELLPELRRVGLTPDAALIGEPTSLDLAVAQKGLMVCELKATGRSVHAAHARALGARNPIIDLAHDLVHASAADLGAASPDLGPTTVEPTMLSGGIARNLVPAEASCILDVRVNPSPSPEEVAEKLRASVRRAEFRVLSARLRPKATPVDAAIVRACLRARPEAKTFGSRGASDWCFYGDTPAVKVGPGATERSHTPDEWIDVREIPLAASFYVEAALAWSALAREGRTAEGRASAAGGAR